MDITQIIGLSVGGGFILVSIVQIVLAIERDKMQIKDAITGWLLAIVWCAYALIFSL